MNNFFNLDNKFFTTLGKVFDMMCLSVVWALLCIPIITIGPANTAMYYATVKVIRRERGYLMREFFRSFRLNFKRAAILGVMFTIMFVVLGFDLFYARASINSENNSSSILFGVFVAITILIASVSTYVYPVLSRFDMTIKQLLKACIFLAIRHLPFTAGMLVITAAGIVAVLFYPLAIFLAPAGVTFLNSFLMERVMKKYMPKPEEGEENTSKDEWYLE
ncbi:YesL family protein [Lachnospiraceae bacterium MD1]|jgi:uncharacterized membrane protein YesL|uniref:YesL family protein n=1 Tax=Variimorphobacter saccharofermentans TaxID=2755051 RepID=A0A839JX47_9FIRM|nr:YesL family protein [Variimorphobacter saccharofermentans]MBB2182255.1 YesL family protein [Variimorphobacter saccharofermentans]